MRGTIRPIRRVRGKLIVKGIPLGELLLPENALEIIRGSSVILELSVTEENAKGLEQAFDLTGSQIFLTVKNKAEDEFPLIRVTTVGVSPPITITKPRGGLAEIELEASNTAKLDPGNYRFDVWVVTSADKRHPVVEETALIVRPAITLLI